MSCGPGLVVMCLQLQNCANLLQYPVRLQDCCGLGSAVTMHAVALIVLAGCKTLCPHLDLQYRNKPQRSCPPFSPLLPPAHRPLLDHHPGEWLMG